MFLDGPIELFNIWNMLLLGREIEDDAKISHLRTKWFKFATIMYVGDLETTLQVQFVDLLDPLLTVLLF